MEKEDTLNILRQQILKELGKHIGKANTEFDKAVIEVNVREILIEFLNEYRWLLNVKRFPVIDIAHEKRIKYLENEFDILNAKIRYCRSKLEIHELESRLFDVSSFINKLKKETKCKDYISVNFLDPINYEEFEW